MSSIQRKVDGGMNNYRPADPAMIGKKDWGWDSEGLEEQVVACSSEEGETPVSDGKPTV